MAVKLGHRNMLFLIQIIISFVHKVIEKYYKVNEFIIKVDFTFYTGFFRDINDSGYIGKIVLNSLDNGIGVIRCIYVRYHNLHKI